MGDGVNQTTVMWSQNLAGDMRQLLRRDRLTLICGARPDAERVVHDLGRLLGVTPASVSVCALSPSVAATPERLTERLVGNSLLFDVEALCWKPWMNLAPVRFLRSLARESGVVAVWPGEVEQGTVEFSTPGRRDHVRENARDITVLRSRPTSFPDQVPFTMEGH